MPSPATGLRALIVADDPLARAGLATLLADQTEWTIAGQVPGETDLALAVEVYLPDVVVWDLGWDPTVALERMTDLEAGLPIVGLLPDETHAVDA